MSLYLPGGHTLCRVAMNPTVAGAEFEDVPKRRVRVPGDMHSTLFNKKFMGLVPLRSNGTPMCAQLHSKLLLPKKDTKYWERDCAGYVAPLDVCKRAGWHTGAALTYLRWTLRDQEVP